MGDTRKFKVGDRVIKNLFCSYTDDGRSLTGHGFLPKPGSLGVVENVSRGLHGEEEIYAIRWNNAEISGSSRWNYDPIYLDHVMSGEF